jgi:hypothetical protein
MARTQFGSIQAIVSKTPMWVKITFGIITILTTVASFIISTDPAIDDALKVRLITYLKGLDLAVLGFSQLFGVVHDDDVNNTGNGGIITPLLVIAVTAMLFASCTTAKKCAAKFPPQIITVDSLVQHDTTIYRDTIIRIPGERVTVIQYLKDTTQAIDTTVKNGKTSIRLQLSKGKLSATCNADSLQLVINNLTTIIKDRQRFKSQTVKVPYPVIEYKVPKWCWWLLAGNILAAILFVLWLMYKVQINSFFLKNRS